MGRQQAEDRRQRVHPLHALHQRHAPGPETSETTPALTILFGAKAPILEGAQMAPLHHSLYEGRKSPMTKSRKFIEKMWDWWMEEGKNRERLGELIQRQGFAEAPRGDRH